jgi:hypothetical protein
VSFFQSKRVDRHPAYQAGLLPALYAGNWWYGFWRLYLNFAHVWWTPAVTLRAFGGVNYDNRVPGITNPTFPDSAPTSMTPAAIYFANETSYYGGGGFLARF